MQVTYQPFKEFGDCSAIRNFQDITSDYDEDNMLFGLVLFDSDDMESIKTQLKLGMGNASSIIMIELCHLSDTQESIDKVIEIKNFIKECGNYTDMESYGSRLAYGLLITDWEQKYEELRLEYNELVDKYNELNSRYEEFGCSIEDYDEDGEEL